MVTVYPFITLTCSSLRRKEQSASMSQKQTGMVLVSSDFMNSCLNKAAGVDFPLSIFGGHQRSSESESKSVRDPAIERPPLAPVEQQHEPNPQFEHRRRRLGVQQHHVIPDGSLMRIRAGATLGQMRQLGRTAEQAGREGLSTVREGSLMRLMNPAPEILLRPRR